MDSSPNSTPLIITLSAFSVLSFLPKMILPVKFSPAKNAFLSGITIASKLVSEASILSLPSNMVDSN